MSSTHKVRTDYKLPTYPVELSRFILLSALANARENQSVSVSLPPGKDLANQIVNQTAPIEGTVITEIERTF